MSHSQLASQTTDMRLSATPVRFPVRSQGALRRGDARAFDADGIAERARDTLERRLDDVVTVLAADAAEMQRHAGTVDEALPEFLGELRVERPDPLRDGVDVVDEVRTA